MYYLKSLTDYSPTFDDANVMTKNVPRINKDVNLSTKHCNKSIKPFINTNDNMGLMKLLKVEEINSRIDDLIKLREELKSQYEINDITLIFNKHTGSWDEKFLFKLFNYIKKNMDNTELNVSSIMSQMHLSRTQLHRKIKALTGLSTTEFIKTVRLKKAEQLLKQNVDSITQISYQIGFSDHSYFSKCFKKEYGISPSEYTKKFQLY